MQEFYWIIPKSEPFFIKIIFLSIKKRSKLYFNAKTEFKLSNTENGYTNLKWIIENNPPESPDRKNAFICLGKSIYDFYELNDTLSYEYLSDKILEDNFKTEYLKNYTEYLIQKGNTAYAAHILENEDINTLDKMLKERLAYCFLQLGLMNKSLNIYDILLINANSEDKKNYMLTKGYIYNYLHEYSSADSVYNELLSDISGVQDSVFCTVKYIKALNHSDNNEFQEAQTIYDELLDNADSPFSVPELYFIKGVTYMAAEDNQNAETIFNYIIENYSENEYWCSQAFNKIEEIDAGGE